MKEKNHTINVFRLSDLFYPLFVIISFLLLWLLTGEVNKESGRYSTFTLFFSILVTVWIVLLLGLLAQRKVASFMRYLVGQEDLDALLRSMAVEMREQGEKQIKVQQDLHSAPSYAEKILRVDEAQARRAFKRLQREFYKIRGVGKGLGFLVREGSFKEYLPKDNL